MNPLAAFGTWTMSFAVTNLWRIALHTGHRKEHDYGKVYRHRILPMQVGYKVGECDYKDCPYRTEPMTNAQKIRSMSDEEPAEFLTYINPTNCQDCAFSHGWRCQPDRDDYSDFEKCEEGRKRWLKQPAE